jgi:hypothetical protein
MVYALVDILLDYVFVFVNLILLWVIGMRKTNGLWTVQQPWMNGIKPGIAGEQTALLAPANSTAIELNGITLDRGATFTQLPAIHSWQTSTQWPQPYAPYPFPLGTQVCPVEAHGQPVHRMEQSDQSQPFHIHEACSPVYEICSSAYMIGSPVLPP